MDKTVPETIEISTYVKRGIMIVRRDALDGDDPDYPYNYVKDTLGLRPEDYGLEKPETPVRGSCHCCGRPY